MEGLGGGPNMLHPDVFLSKKCDVQESEKHIGVGSACDRFGYAGIHVHFYHWRCTPIDLELDGMPSWRNRNGYR